MKQDANQLYRVLRGREEISDSQYIIIAARFLSSTFNAKVYYHIGDHITYNLVEPFFVRFIKSILDPHGDIELIHKNCHPVMRAYDLCMSSMSCDSFTFSSNSNQISVDLNIQHPTMVQWTEIKIVLTISLYWGMAYERGLAEAESIIL